MTLELFLRVQGGSSATDLRLLREEIDRDGSRSFEAHKAGPYLGVLLDEIQVGPGSGSSDSWKLTLRGEPVGELRADLGVFTMHVTTDEYWALANVSEAMKIAAADDPVECMRACGIEVADVDAAREQAREIVRVERQHAGARAAQLEAERSVIVLRR